MEGLGKSKKKNAVKSKSKKERFEENSKEALKLRGRLQELKAERVEIEKED